MWEVLLEAVIDSLKVFPVLLVVYILIELIEHKSAKKFKYNKILNNKFSPIVSSAVGIVPQCGFSLIATDLFSKKKITVASLVAIYLATSDEALPILLSNKDGLKAVLPLLLIKFVYAILIGYLITLIIKISSRKKVVVSDTIVENTEDIYKEKSSETIVITETEEENTIAIQDKPITMEFVVEEEHEKGCCGHELEHKKSNFKAFFVHPLVHSLKIFAFILVVNILFGILLHLVGIESLSKVLLGDSVFQSFLVGLIGLIPNCVSSVIVTELYLLGGISFGGCLAGLCANSGLAMVMLFKENKNIKENLAILFTTYFSGVVLGIVVDLILLVV